jgi:hypothetical protein
VKKLAQSALLAFLFCTSIKSIAFPISNEDINKLANDKLWLKLLHYNESTQKSYITSKSFFLTKNSSFTPKKELVATVDALYSPLQNGQPASTHAQCMFPARLIFLKKNIKRAYVNLLPQITCNDYDTWKTEKNTTSISIIFASGYMSNPASMYGHLLLKLNQDKTSQLLNYSFNYGAIVPRQENPILYVMKGILGGYDAGYSDQQFYRHHHNYSDIELRDMWEYELNISSADIDLVVAHLWELLGKKFTYYFIDENCAFHIAKLLELITDKPIINNKSLWVIPSSVARGISKAKYKQQALLKDINFVPSSENILHQYIQKLNQQQRYITHQIIQKNFDFTIDGYLKLPRQDKKIIADILFQYLEVIKQKDIEKNSIAILRKRLISERLKLSPGKVFTPSATTNKSPPHQGMKPSKFSLGYYNSNKKNHYVSTGFRMTYYDVLSSSVARNPFSNLEMLDFELLTNNEQVKVLKFDIIDIKSLYKENTPWLEKNDAAWTISTGYQQHYNNCLNCGIYYLKGEWGKSSLINNWLAFALIGGKAFVGDESNLDISLRLGLITPSFYKLKAKLEIQQATTANFNTLYKMQFTAAINYHIAKNWELRLQAEKKETTTFALKLNYFWEF